MCLVIKNPTETAGLKWAIEILPNRYTPIATPTNGANAIKGKPKIPFNFASATNEPVAKTTTTNIPMSSARNRFWSIVSLSTTD